MLHWAAIPLETVLEGYDSMECNWMETEYQGVKMLVEPCGQGCGRVVRLLSPNPYDYLKPNLAPGSIVPLFQPEQAIAKQS
ncbi:YlzJ-like family protein [Effusibacillus pohliae]|uniref:YlzJ-like family protein n=1 Tax=Effusibacillus pohliae TaxID=232270 RepID=UPI0003815FC3|nr:YlzJ-like family protein [Effusibacillus pohliae]